MKNIFHQIANPSTPNDSRNFLKKAALEGIEPGGMITGKKFDILRLKGKLGRIRDLMRNHHFPPFLLFSILGIISTIWFLLRVIPKPSRASYPCMQVAAPLMSGFVVYLLSLGGITLALRKAKPD